MHFSHLTSFNQPKNKLQREVLSLLQSESNQMVNDAKDFVKHLTRSVDELNHAHQNCTFLKVATYGLGDQISISLGEQFTVGFHLYPFKSGGAA